MGNLFLLILILLVRIQLALGSEFTWSSPEYAKQANRTSCKPLQRYESSALKKDENTKKYNKTSLGSVNDVEVCGQLCCEMESCDMVLFEDGRKCYAIQCADIEGCRFEPIRSDDKKVQSEILTFSKKTGNNVSLAKDGKSQENKANIVTQKASVQTKSAIPGVDTDSTKQAGSLIALSKQEKQESPMDALLREEIAIVKKKEEKEKSDKRENIVREQSKKISNVGKEIQDITGEHYLKADDKGDNTALQENDNATMHSKLSHQHRRDLRHNLISPITIGAFTCMAVIAVSGFTMAIIKYKKERKEVEDKQTQLP